MKIKAFLAIGVVASFLSGCASLQFNREFQPGALTYYDPVPIAVVKTSADCVTTVEITSVPGPERSVRFKSGYGSNSLSVSMANGVLTSVNQTTDTKIPDTITAITGLATAASGILSLEETPSNPICKIRTTIHQISYKEEKLMLGKPIFSIDPTTIDTTAASVGGPNGALSEAITPKPDN